MINQKCKFFFSGKGCFRGADCNFSHDGAGAVSGQPAQSFYAGAAFRPDHEDRNWDAYQGQQQMHQHRESSPYASLADPPSYTAMGEHAHNYHEPRPQHASDYGSYGRGDERSINSLERNNNYYGRGNERSMNSAEQNNNYYGRGDENPTNFAEQNNRHGESDHAHGGHHPNSGTGRNVSHGVFGKSNVSKDCPPNNPKSKNFKDPSACRLKDHNHLWSQCPNNPMSKNFNGVHFKDIVYTTKRHTVSAEMNSSRRVPPSKASVGKYESVLRNNASQPKTVTNNLNASNVNNFPKSNQKAPPPPPHGNKSNTTDKNASLATTSNNNAPGSTSIVSIPRRSPTASQTNKPILSKYVIPSSQLPLKQPPMVKASSNITTNNRQTAQNGGNDKINNGKSSTLASFIAKPKGVTFVPTDKFTIHNIGNAMTHSKNTSSIPKKASGKSALAMGAASRSKNPAEKSSLFNTTKTAKQFVPRSQRALSGKTAVAKVAPPSILFNQNNKKRKLQGQPKPQQAVIPTKTIMRNSRGRWRKESIPAAPVGNGAIAIQKQRSSRLLTRENLNPFTHQGSEPDKSNDHNGDLNSSSSDDMSISDSSLPSLQPKRRKLQPKQSQIMQQPQNSPKPPNKNVVRNKRKGSLQKSKTAAPLDNSFTIPRRGGKKAQKPKKNDAHISSDEEMSSSSYTSESNDHQSLTSSIDDDNGTSFSPSPDKEKRKLPPEQSQTKRHPQHLSIPRKTSFRKTGTSAVGTPLLGNEKLSKLSANDGANTSHHKKSIPTSDSEGLFDSDSQSSSSDSDFDIPLRAVHKKQLKTKSDDKASSKKDSHSEFNQLIAEKRETRLATPSQEMNRQEKSSPKVALECINLCDSSDEDSSDSEEDDTRKDGDTSNLQHQPDLSSRQQQQHLPNTQSQPHPQSQRLLDDSMAIEIERSLFEMVGQGLKEEEDARRLADVEEEKKAKVKAEQLEKKRVEKEKCKTERLEHQRLEAEAKAQLEAARLAKQQQIEHERLERVAKHAEEERLEKERLEQQRLEQQRLAAEAKAQQEAARLAEQERTRIAREKLKLLEQQEQQRLAAEAKARLKTARLAEQERMRRLDRERATEAAAMLAEVERLEKERLEQQRLEQQRLAAEAKAQQEAARLAEQERTRIARERLEREKRVRVEAQAAAKHAEEERLENERLEQQRLEQQRLAAEAKAQQEAARLAEQERTRIVHERLEREKRARSEAEAAAKHAEEERLENERLEQQRLEQQRLAAEAKAQQEAARLAEQERTRIARERLEREKRARSEAEEAAKHAEEERLENENERLEQKRLLAAEAKAQQESARLAEHAEEEERERGWSRQEMALLEGNALLEEEEAKKNESETNGQLTEQPGWQPHPPQLRREQSELSDQSDQSQPSHQHHQHLSQEHTNDSRVIEMEIDLFKYLDYSIKCAWELQLEDQNAAVSARLPDLSREALSGVGQKDNGSWGQQVDAKQTSNNCLVSDDVPIFSKCKVPILGMNVSCTHLEEEPFDALNLGDEDSKHDQTPDLEVDPLSGEDSENNDLWPIYSCNKCGMEFIEFHVADKHESECTTATLPGDEDKLHDYTPGSDESDRTDEKQSSSAHQVANNLSAQKSISPKKAPNNVTLAVAEGSHCKNIHHNDNESNSLVANSVRSGKRKYPSTEEPTQEEDATSEVIVGEGEVKVSSDGRWEMYYKELVQFKKTHGHIQVPTNCKPNPLLGNLYAWLYRQKTLGNKLPPTCAEKLAQLGVEFKSKKVNQRQNSKDPSDDDSEPAEMNIVKHLTSTVLDSVTGLPTKKMTFICGDSETLYDFQIDIRPSNIPNAGHGAFLTFLGARVLKKEAENRTSNLMKQHIVDGEIATKRHLTASTMGGLKMDVTLTGRNLYRNENNPYWSKNREKALASNMDNNSNVRDDFDENSVQCEIHQEVQRLRSKIPTGRGIGFLGINSESDYVEDKDKLCSFPTGMFEIGRYGPFKPEDRKPELHFAFKNFVHSFEPAEWCYDVEEEKIMNETQLVDITDDATGELHELAKKHATIYVNEVGHNANLHANVLIREKNDRSIHYYACIDEQHAMRKGDCVELLVDYAKKYEEVRERKGYGVVNIVEGVGDDRCDGARLQRNFTERKLMEDLISSLSTIKMFYLTEFLMEKIFVPIHEVMQDIIKQQNSNSIRSRVIVARRRLHWLGERLELRLAKILSNPDDIFAKNTSFTSDIQKSLHKFNWSSMSTIFSIMKNSFSSDTHENAQETLLCELSEELLYHVSLSLPKPLDEHMWSKLAINLTNETTRHISRFMSCYSGSIDSRKRDLTEVLLRDARKSARAIREGSDAINMQHSGLSEDEIGNVVELFTFKSTKQKIKQRYFFYPSKQSTKKSLLSMYDSHPPIHFGTAAALAEIQAYQDAAELGSLDSFAIPGMLKNLTECDLSVVSHYTAERSDNSNGCKPQFYWMARGIDAFKKGVAHVNTQWYLENQLLLVMHLLASNCVDWGCSRSGEELYSLEKLCRAIEIDPNIAAAALSQGPIVPNWPERNRVKSAFSTVDNEESGITVQADRTNGLSRKKRLK